MTDAGAARRADDAAGRRPRDDGVRARLGVRAPRPLARRAGAAGRRDRRRRRRRVPDGHDPGDPAPPAGAAERRAAAGEAAGRRSAAGTTRRASAWSPTPTWSTTTPRSIPTPTRSARSASSRSSPAPTRGSRSGAGGAAASAPASRCVEMKIVLQAVLSRCEVRPGIDGVGGEPAAGDHGEPEPARRDRPARPSRGAWQRAPGRGRGRTRGYDGLSRPLSRSELHRLHLEVLLQRMPARARGRGRTACSRRTARAG